MDTNAWRTPRCIRKWLLDVYAPAHGIRIVGDACASDHNHWDVRYYYTEAEDAMQRNWSVAEKAKENPKHPLKGKIYDTNTCCDQYRGTATEIDYWVINPPYRRTKKGYEPTDWFRKCYNQALKGVGVIMIVQPTDGEQNRWGKYVFGKAKTIYNIERRVAFAHPDTGIEDKGASFGTWIIIYDPILLCDRESGCNEERESMRMFKTTIEPLYL